MGGVNAFFLYDFDPFSTHRNLLFGIFQIVPENSFLAYFKKFTCHKESDYHNFEILYEAALWAMKRRLPVGFHLNFRLGSPLIILLHILTFLLGLFRKNYFNTNETAGKVAQNKDIGSKE